MSEPTPEAVEAALALESAKDNRTRFECAQVLYHKFDVPGLFAAEISARILAAEVRRLTIKLNEHGEPNP